MKAPASAALDQIPLKQCVLVGIAYVKGNYINICGTSVQVGIEGSLAVALAQLEGREGRKLTKPERFILLGIAKTYTGDMP